MTIETSLLYTDKIREQLSSQAQTNKDQSDKTFEDFNTKLENNLSEKTTSNDKSFEIFKNIKSQNIDYENIYANMKELEKNLNPSINTNDKFYNDIKIGLTKPFENYHNLSKEEQNNIKETTVNIFGAEKGTVRLITCTSVRQFYSPIISIALGEVMSYMSIEDSIAFGNNFQKNINNAMKDTNLLTTNEEGVALLNFDEKPFLNFIYSIMKDNEGNEKDKYLNNLYENVLKETDRRYHPFETMEREEALRNKLFQQEKALQPKEDELVESTKEKPISKLLTKNNLSQNLLNEIRYSSKLLYLKNFNSYDYLKVINELNNNSEKK